MKHYLNIVSQVLTEGEVRDLERTGDGTKALFRPQTFTHDLKQGFPALTTKRLFFKGVVEELLWFMRYSTDASELEKAGVGIWTKDALSYYLRLQPSSPFAQKVISSGADPETFLEEFKSLLASNGETYGHLGPVYGYQFSKGDQLVNFINGLKTNPQGRRHIISLWSPDELVDMALPPCHGLVIQGYISSDNHLNLSMYMRSADIFLGLPFNIASYALLLEIVADLTGLQPGKLYIDIGDAHIYNSHTDAVAVQMGRNPLELPTINFPRGLSIRDWVGPTQTVKASDISLVGYNNLGPIKAEMKTSY